MNVGMKQQLLIPGMKRGGKTVDVSPEALLVGEFFGQGAGNSGKEQVVSFLGQWAQEKAAQLGGQREGHQEVGSPD